MTNPVGAVPIFDGGVPRIFTAICNVGVTGGQLVYCSGGAGAVSSGANSFVASDIIVAGVASGAQFNGMVITPGNTASGNYVSIASQGTFIIQADGAVVGGYPVETMGNSAVEQLGSRFNDAGPTKIGRAITGAASGTSNFAVVYINP